MWPMFFLIAALLTIAEQFGSSLGLIGPKIFAYSMLIYLAHQAILSGHFSISGRVDKNQTHPPRILRFFGLVFLISWLPLIVGAILAFFLLSGLRATNVTPFILITLVPVWLSLTFFGTSYPQRVWFELTGETSKTHQDRRPVWIYVGTRLLLWNSVYFVFTLVISFALSWIARTDIGASIPFLNLGFDFLMEGMSYIALTLTAAVLSHAHLRANDLGPQGLIERL